MAETFQPTQFPQGFCEGENIQAKVVVDPCDPTNGWVSYVTLRKVVVKDKKIVRKESMTIGGDWITVPEGAHYPETCRLPLCSLVFERHERIL